MRVSCRVNEQPDSLLVELQRPDGTWTSVGQLLHNGSSNWFEFSPEYWDQGARPVLGQIFEEHGRDWKPRANVALPRWFSHLLPEGRMRNAVAVAADVHAAREFELIRRLGATDLPGATRALPFKSDGSRTAPELEDDSGAVDENPLLKFSLAGAQIKYSMVRNERGLTIPAKGRAGDTIAKLPDGRPGFEGVPEAEFSALELARASGMNVVSTKLVSVKDITGIKDWFATPSSATVLAVERFDRHNGEGRVHVEELAQVMDIPTARENAKYRYANFETVANFISALSGVDTVAEVIDRIVLNVLVGNGDAHLKNWAFTYADGQNPTLSPLYDVVPTVLYMPKDNLGLNLNGTKDFDSVTERSFDDLGRRSGFGVSESRNRVRAAVGRILANWEILQTTLYPDHYKRLTDRVQSLPLARLGGRYV